MCGIVAYSGHRPAVPLLIEGLHRLEYRGYDSSGVAFLQAGKLHVVKAAGKLSALEVKLATEPNVLSTCGIGHTRWATHGAPVERNAHPQMAQGGTLALVHNGIIENFQELRDELTASGCSFVSDTDTEVLACLIEEERKRASSMLEAFARALRRARGAYAVAMVSAEEPGMVYGARLSAPLLIGVGAGECFVASDIPAFLAYTRDVVFPEDGEIVRIGRKKAHEGGATDARAWELFRLDDLAPVCREVTRIEWDMQAACKDGFKHFMLKEIMEQPRVLADCMAGRIAADPARDESEGVRLPELDGLEVPKRLRIVACGTSFNAGLWGARLLEKFGGVPVTVEIASEFRYRDPLLEEGEAVLAISQSGETADTLAALRLAREKGHITLGLCNVMGSAVAREADAVLYTQAGPEISVASTKAMCSQMAVLLLLALYWGKRKGMKGDADLLARLRGLPELLNNALPAMRETAARTARAYAGARSFFFLGRGPACPLALEGALKLKELSYIHAEGYAAGEMKHGPIALVDPEFPTFALALRDEFFSKIVSNIEQVQARQGKVIVLTQMDAGGECGDLHADVLWILPSCRAELASFLALPALQLFSYEVADYLGKDVDQPRNLAKSVTVE